ncbi:sigma-70 family RNA polymerase sigma factor [Pantoea sp. At-9b]|uniref:sigma-70 family RNA polymerase sigma factor n=1 Tax=Pantoea sp. (strain At-9b) TaxID=592316 RepID=UPI001CBF7E50|nr:sigma-70 family RNA polymerase sigma factor [Pantoea sp. At-9b]
MIVPLQKQTEAGKLYTRLPETETRLVELSTLPDKDLIELCKQSKTHPQYVPSECLLYFVRRSAPTNQTLFDPLFRILSERIFRKLPRTVNPGGNSVSMLNSDVQESVLDRFVEMLMLDKVGYEERLDIFELRFDMAFLSLKKDAFQKSYRSEKRNTELEYNDSEDITSEVEAVSEGYNPFEETDLNNFHYCRKLDATIETLPDLQKRIIEMIRLDFPIDSIDPNEMTISKALNKSEKTIHNQKNKAFARLLKLLEGGI